MACDVELSNAVSCD